MRPMRLSALVFAVAFAAAAPVFAAQETAGAGASPFTPAASAAALPAGVTKTVSNAAQSQEPPPLPMKASFAAKSVEAGDVAVLDLSFSLPEKASLDDPPRIGGLPEGGAFSVKKTPSGLSVGLLADSLDTFKVGPLTLSFTGKDGKRGTFKSEPAAISVTTSLSSEPAKQTPRPMKELMPVGFAYKKQALFAIAVIAALIAIFFLWRFLGRRRKKLSVVHAIPPHQAALAALDRLAENFSLSDKDFAFELSAIVRAYMGSIRPFPAAEMTYEEIASAAALSEDREVLPVLRATDMVKFAASVPTSRDRQEQVARVRDYVTATMPKPEAAKDAPGGREANS